MKINEDGLEKKVTESYLLDAMSYTEAEARVIKEMESLIQGDYYIKKLSKSNITELVTSIQENDDRWFKVKVSIIDADELHRKERCISTYYLVSASDINSALKNTEKALFTFIVPWAILSITDTDFMDVFPYFPDKNKEIHENLAQ